MRSQMQIFLPHKAIINEGEWTEIYSIYIRTVHQWEVRTLCLSNHLRSTMLQEIAHIHFSHLTSLNLSGNQLQSMEAANTISMPHLQQLRIANNNLVAVGLLRKAHWPCLAILNTCSNYIRDLPLLTEASLPCLKQLLVSNFFGVDKNRFVNHYFYAKLESHSLEQIGMKSRNFCSDRCIKPRLRKRWKNVRVGFD